MKTPSIVDANPSRYSLNTPANGDKMLLNRLRQLPTDRRVLKNTQKQPVMRGDRGTGGHILKEPALFAFSFFTFFIYPLVHKPTPFLKATPRKIFLKNNFWKNKILALKLTRPQW